MTIITNANNRQINFEAAYMLMDREIVEELGTMNTDQEFFEAYSKSHIAKFGEEFEPNKPNPIW